MKTTSIIIKADGSQAYRETKKVSSGLGDLDQKSIKAAGSMSRLGSAVSSFGSRLKSAGQSMTMFGGAMALSVTMPLLAFGATAVKTSVKMDSLKRGLSAVTKEAGPLEVQLARLKEIAKLPGLGLTEAIQGSINLQAAGMSAGTAERALKSFGNALATVGKGKTELEGVILALQQISAKGKVSAEEINQINERVPQIRQAMKDAFGTSDTEKLGKMGIDAEKFISGVITQLEKLPAVAGGAQNTLENLSDTVSQALLPLGDALLPAVIQTIETISPILERLSQGFAALDPTIQKIIIGVAGIAIAAGPVILAIGAIVSAIGAIASVVPSVGVIGLALGGLLSIFAPLTLAVAELYLAWQTNFGGIRDFAAAVAAGVRELWAQAMKNVADITSTVVAQVTAFWAENGEDIMKAVSRVSEFIKGIWTSLVQYWRDHGEEIKAITGAMWDQIKNIVTAAITTVGNIIKLIAAIINGDWGKAWQAAKDIVKNALQFIGNSLKNAGPVLVSIFKLIWDGIWTLGAWLAQKFGELAKWAIEGLINGIKSRAKSLAETIVSTLTFGLINPAKQALDSHSPSRVFRQIGVDTIFGLIVGLDAVAPKMQARAKSIAGELIKTFRTAVDEFRKLASMSSEDLRVMEMTEKAKKGTAGLEEIIKLRNELGVNKEKSLPGNLGDVERELADLQRQKTAQDEYNQSLEDMRKIADDIKAFREEDAKLVAEQIQKLREAGEIDVLNMQKEIELLGVTSEYEKARIEAAYDLKIARAELMADGFGAHQINEILEVRKAEKARLLELAKIKETTELAIEERKKQIEAAKKAAEEAQKAVEALGDRINDSLGRIFQGFGGGIKSGLKSIWNEINSIFEQGMRSLLSGVSQSLAQIFSKFLNPGGAAGGSSSGGWGSIFSGIFSPGGNGPGGTPPIFSGSNFFSPGGGSSSSGISLPGHELGHLAGGGGGLSGLWGNIKSLFGPKPNMLNGGKPSAMGGMMGGIGSIAALAGGMMGGRVGGILSMAGTGMSIGAMFGPWGAAIGAGVGALVGLFGGDPKRKRDKKEKLPALNRGFVDSLSELRALVGDVRSLRVDPDSAISKATELRAQIASGFGLQFESKKYRKQSQTLIAAKLVEADAIIKDLREAAEISRAAGERDRRMIPEFAGGVDVSGFARRNGLLAGAWTGRDTIPAMLAAGEIVLNPAQQNRIRRMTGFDPFAKAGIPGYSTGGGIPQAAGSSTSAGGGDTVIPITLSIDRDGMVQAYAQSDAGRRVIIKIVEDGYSNDTLKLKRR